MAIKLEGGGGKALGAGPLKKYRYFFAASLHNMAAHLELSTNWFLEVFQCILTFSRYLFYHLSEPSFRDKIAKKK